LREEEKYKAEYEGFGYQGTRFLIGYGLDHSGFCRGMKDIITAESYSRTAQIDRFLEKRGELDNEE